MVISRIYPLKVSSGLFCGLFLIICGIACSVNPKSFDVIYLIPNKFEGAVVVIYDRKDGDTPQLDGKSHTLTVPYDGIVKVTASEKDLNGRPQFFYVDENGNRSEIEYLHTRKIDPQSNIRTEEDISAEEKENKVFAMIYEKTSKANTKIVFARSFLIAR